MSIFPDRAAAQPPVGAAPAKQDDQWTEGCRCLAITNHHDPAAPADHILEAAA